MRPQLVDRLRVRVGVPGFRIIPNGAVTHAGEVPWRVAAEAGSAAGEEEGPGSLGGETVCVQSPLGVEDWRRRPWPVKDAVGS